MSAPDINALRQTFFEVVSYFDAAKKGEKAEAPLYIRSITSREAINNIMKGILPKHYMIMTQNQDGSVNTKVSADLAQRVTPQTTVREVDDSGRVKNERAVGSVGALNESDRKMLDIVIEEVRAEETARLATLQDKTTEFQKGVGTVTFAEGAPQAKTTGKTAKPGTVPLVVGKADAEATRARQRYESEQASRERAEERRRGLQEYTKARDEKQQIIQESEEEFRQKKDFINENEVQ